MSKTISPGTRVKLRKNALYPDKIPIPRRFLKGEYTVLSRSGAVALLDGIMRHVECRYLRTLEESENVWYTNENETFKGSHTG